MSKENLVKLMEAVASDPQLEQQWQHAASYQAIKTLAHKLDIDLGDLSEQEAVRTIGVVTGAITEELSEGELDLVTGGFKNSGGLDHCLKLGPPKSFASPEGPYAFASPEGPYK